MGYEGFQLTYPMETTDSKFKPLSLASNVCHSSGVEDVEYPNIDDIQMKDQTMLAFSSKQSPFIDRSSKDAAAKKYSEHTDLLQEKEQLAQKSLNNQKNALKLELLLQEVRHFKNNLYVCTYVYIVFLKILR